MSTAKNFLPGVWRLVSVEMTYPDGRVTQPFGTEPKGLIVYTESGWMSVHAMHPKRPLFASEDAHLGTPEEIRAAFEGYAGYFGRYELDIQAETVTHRLVGAHMPNWVGSDQKRFYSLLGNRITLTTPPMHHGGGETTSKLVWEKVG